MKLIAQIENEELELSIINEEGKIFAEIDGRKYQLESSEPEPNVYLLKYQNQIFEVFVSPDSDQSEAKKVSVKNDAFDIQIIDPKRLRGAGSTAGSADGIAEIKTAMPGKVVKVIVEIGEEVNSNQGVIIVEAMKMQNEMKSPKDGVIKEIKFNEGDTVNAGDVLVIIE